MDAGSSRILSSSQHQISLRTIVTLTTQRIALTLEAFTVTFQDSSFIVLVDLYCIGPIDVCM